MPKQKLTRGEIRWDKQVSTWFYRELVGRVWHRNGTSHDPTEQERPTLTKAAFVRAIIDKLKARVAEGAYGFSLRICDRDGKWIKGDRGEKTIPRSADPKRSKG